MIIPSVRLLRSASLPKAPIALIAMLSPSPQ